MRLPFRYSVIGLILVFAPMYLGPILTGWSGGNLTQLGLCAIAFGLYTVLTRYRSSPPVTALPAVIVSGAIGALFVALGWGIASLTGTLSLSPYFGVAVAIGAALAAAFLFRHNREIDDLLDEVSETADKAQSNLKDFE